MSRPIFPDGLTAVVTDLERRLRILEAASRSGLGLPQGTLVTELNPSLDFGTAEIDVVAVAISVGERRRIRIGFHTHIFNNDFVHPGGNNTVRIRIMEGATELARRMQASIADSADTTARDETDIDGEIFVRPTAGPHTYKIRAQITNGPSQNMTIVGGAVDPAWISVEDVGMVPPT